MSIEEKLHNLKWRLELAHRYHDRCLGFFSGWHTFSMVMVAGSASFVAGALSKTSTSLWALMPPAVATAFTLLDVLVGFADRANKHWELRSRFNAVERMFVGLRTNPTAKGLDEVEAGVLRIEIDEPKVLRVLDTVCHNELAHAWGYGPEYQMKLTWLQRMLAQITDIQEHKLRQPLPAPA